MRAASQVLLRASLIASLVREPPPDALANPQRQSRRGVSFPRFHSSFIADLEVFLQDRLDWLNDWLTGWPVSFRDQYACHHTGLFLRQNINSYSHLRVTVRKRNTSKMLRLKKKSVSTVVRSQQACQTLLQNKAQSYRGLWSSSPLPRCPAHDSLLTKSVEKLRHSVWTSLPFSSFLCLISLSLPPALSPSTVCSVDSVTAIPQSAKGQAILSVLLYHLASFPVKPFPVKVMIIQRKSKTG